MYCTVFNICKLSLLASVFLSAKLDGQVIKNSSKIDTIQHFLHIIIYKHYTVHSSMWNQSNQSIYQAQLREF